jgi:hypothetical protein
MCLRVLGGTYKRPSRRQVFICTTAKHNSVNGVEVFRKIFTGIFNAGLSPDHKVGWVVVGWPSYHAVKCTVYGNDYFTE